MNVNLTIDQLREMKLFSMADNYLAQIEDPKIQSLSFDERFGMLVSIEYNSRENSQIKRLIQKAELDQPQASIADINYTSGRNLDRELILKLASCEYIERNLNIFITGATGCGKTYLACALGMEACKQQYRVLYIRLPEMLLEMKIARESNLLKKVLQKYTKPRLLILDEWLLIKVPQDSQYDLMELIHHRSKGSSTIFCSQFRPEGWYEQLGGEASPLAEAILDRIMHTAYKVEIKAIDPSKDRSMREVYGLKSTQN